MISKGLIDMYPCSFVCTLDIFSMDLFSSTDLCSIFHRCDKQTKKTVPSHNKTLLMMLSGMVGGNNYSISIHNFCL